MHFNHPISSNKHLGSYLKFKLKGGWGGAGGALTKKLIKLKLKNIYIKWKWFDKVRKKEGGTFLIL